MTEETGEDESGSEKPKEAEKERRHAGHERRNQFGRRASDRFHLIRVLTLLGFAFGVSAFIFAVALFFNLVTRLQMI